MGKQKKTIWQRFLKWSELNLFKIAMFAVACGLSGAIILAATIPASADPLEPLFRGVKVLWGVDSYKWEWAKLNPEVPEEGDSADSGKTTLPPVDVQDDAADAQADAADTANEYDATSDAQAEAGAAQADADQNTNDVKKGNALAYLGYCLFELGRIAGFIVFIRAMLKVLDESSVTLTAQRRAKRDIKHGKEVTAIHGDSELAASLVRNLQQEEKRVLFSDADMLKYLEGDYSGKEHELGLTLTAPNQVIVYENDYDAIEFLEKYRDEMPEDARIYVYLDKISAEGVSDPQISVFSMAEICAQLYWRDHPIYPEATGEDFAATLVAQQVKESEEATEGAAPAKPKPRYRVVIIGDGDYTARIVEQALLTNIFDIAGGVRYDVIGDLRMWRMSHPGIDMAMLVNKDEIHFYDGPWYDHWGLIIAADRVILCGKASENIRIAAELQAEPIRELHVRSDYKSSMRLLGERKEGGAGPERVEVFGTIEELCTSALVIKDRAHERGRLRDIVYGLGTPRCNNCPNFDFSGIRKVPDDWNIMDDEREEIRDHRIEHMCMNGERTIEDCLECPFFKGEWRGYDGFTRRSNFAVAAHDGQKFRLLHLLGIPVSNEMSVRDEMRAYAELPEEVRHALQEIEHIRWCRFHYLNGWTFGEGKKDKRRRTHPDLVPYADLQTDQSKDADAYLNLCLTIRSAEEQKELERIWLQ